jgi:hypothetical protein
MLQGHNITEHCIKTLKKIRGYWVFGLCSSCGALKNTLFWKLNMLLSSGERMGDIYSIGLETDNLNHWRSSLKWPTMAYSIVMLPVFMTLPKPVLRSAQRLQWLRLAPSNIPNRVCASQPLTWGWKHIQFQKRRVFYSTGRWTKSKNFVIPRVIHYHQNPLELN